MNKYLLSPLLVAMLLQGCGSDSSETETPSEPVEYTFTLNAKLTNDCGISSAFSDVELLLQDDTWQTLSSYKADANGLISFVTNSEFINYTIIAKDQKDSESEGLNVTSFYQANSATPAYYAAQYDEAIDNSTCECVTQDLELTHRSFASQTSVTSSVSYDSWQEVDENTTLFEGIQVCRVIDESWPLHSFSVVGVDVNDTAIASADFINDFTANDDNLWQASAFDVAESVDLDLLHQEFTTNQIIDNEEHFPTLVAADAGSLLVFKSHSYISEAFYKSQATVTFKDSGSLLGSAVTKKHHQVISTDSQESFAAEASEVAPDVDDIYFSEIAEDGSYDYSAVSGYSMASIAFTFTTYDPETELLLPAKWTFYGPESGLLAISGPLTGYEDIISIDTTKKETDVRLIESSVSGNYQDYIEYYQAGNTVDTAIDATNDFVKNIKLVEIAISVN